MATTLCPAFRLTACRINLDSTFILVRTAYSTNWSSFDVRTKAKKRLSTNSKNISRALLVNRRTNNLVARGFRHFLGTSRAHKLSITCLIASGRKNTCASAKSNDETEQALVHWPRLALFTVTAVNILS